MAFSWNNLRFWFLNDSRVNPTWTTYQTYRTTLTWDLWNKRINDGTDGVPGDNVSFEDSLHAQGDGVNGYAGKFLVGDYKSFDPINNLVPAHHNDFILDSEDPLILGNNPLWQYSWIAIQNLAANPSLYRLELWSEGSDQSASGAWAAYGNDASYTRIKPMGIIRGTYWNTQDYNGRRDFLNRITIAAAATPGLPFMQYFPHIVTHGGYGGDTSNPYKIYWNACAERATYTYGDNNDYGRIMCAMNNWKTQYIADNQGFAGDGRYYPYQVCGWANESDGDRKRPSQGADEIGSRDGMLFDLPSGHTLLAVVCRTRDWNYSERGDSDQAISPAGVHNWNYSDIRVRFSYVVGA